MKIKKTVAMTLAGVALCVAVGATNLNGVAISAENGGTAQAFAGIKLPEYMIKSATYTLPDFEGAKISVKEDGGAKIELTEDEYTVAASSSLEFTYEVNGETYVHSAKVADVGSGKDMKMERFFAIEEGAPILSVDDKKTSVTFQQKSKIQFINFVNVNDFNIEFDPFTENVNYTNMHFIFEDIVTGKTVKITYEKTKRAWNALVGEKTKKLTISQEGYTLDFSADDGMLSFNGGSAVSVSQYEDGSEYKGFTDDKAIFSVVFEEGTALSDFDIYAINGQGLKNEDGDITPPQMFFDTVNVFDARIDEVMTLNAGYALDVLDPAMPKFTVQVKSPSGKIVTAKDGTVLNKCDATKTYQFDLSEYGSYVITYQAEDSFENLRRKIVRIAVTDSRKAEITLSNKVTQGKVGKTISIATATYQDDVTTVENLVIKTYLVSPTMATEEIEKSFKPKTKGIYTVVYIAMDEAENLAVFSYEIEVK